MLVVQPDGSLWSLDHDRLVIKVEGDALETGRTGVKRRYPWTGTEYDATQLVPASMLREGGGTDEDWDGGLNAPAYPPDPATVRTRRLGLRAVEE